MERTSTAKSRGDTIFFFSKKIIRSKRKPKDENLSRMFGVDANFFSTRRVVFRDCSHSSARRRPGCKEE